MITDIHSEPPMDQLSEAAREIAKRAIATAKDVTGVVEDVVGNVTDAAKDAARRATATAKDMCQSAALEAGNALATSKEYVRRNPVPVVLGAIAFGAAIGYMLMTARRRPTFSERYYDLARDAAGKVMDRVPSFGSGRTGHSFSDQIGRIGNNLKFW